MSTRALYSFKDDSDEHHVYKHHDGYPEWASKFIAASLDCAWPLPRFEADEFAASFVAGNKKDAGGVRLAGRGNNWRDFASADIEYHYTMTVKGGAIWVCADRVSQNYDTTVWAVTEIFNGTLADFLLFAKAAA